MKESPRETRELGEALRPYPFLCCLSVESSIQIVRPPFRVFGDSLLVSETGDKIIEVVDIYVMFLFEDRNFESKEQARIQESLQSMFAAFGTKIGISALAVNLVKKDGTLDFTRDHVYQRKFGLSTKKAPHIVILDKHPDDWGPHDRLVCVSFNRTPPDRLYVILGEIMDTVSGGKFPARGLKIRMVYEGVKKWFDDHRSEVKEVVDLVANLKGSS